MCHERWALHVVIKQKAFYIYSYEMFRWLSSVVVLSSSLVCVFFALDYTVTVIDPVNTTVTHKLFANILPNNDSWASSNGSVSAGVSQYPSHWHRRRYAWSRVRSAAEQRPDHAGEQYSLAGTVDLKTLLIDAAGIPWLRSTRCASPRTRR